MENLDEKIKEILKEKRIEVDGRRAVFTLAEILGKEVEESPDDL